MKFGALFLAFISTAIFLFLTIVQNKLIGNLAREGMEQAVNVALAPLIALIYIVIIGATISSIVHSVSTIFASEIGIKVCGILLLSVDIVLIFLNLNEALLFFK